MKGFRSSGDETARRAEVNRTICEVFCHLEGGPFRGDTNLVVHINFQVIGYALHVSDAGLPVEL